MATRRTKKETKEEVKEVSSPRIKKEVPAGMKYPKHGVGDTLYQVGECLTISGPWEVCGITSTKCEHGVVHEYQLCGALDGTENYTQVQTEDNLGSFDEVRDFIKNFLQEKLDILKSVTETEYCDQLRQGVADPLTQAIEERMSNKLPAQAVA